jgi:hypothetical protein
MAQDWSLAPVREYFKKFNTTNKVMNENLEKIKIAIDFLKDGLSFRVGDLRLGVQEDNKLTVTGWTQYSNLDNLNKYYALIEFEEVKSIFLSMLEVSLELKEFIKNKTIQYNLAYDYGMGGVGICSEENGVFTWEYELNK